MSGEHPTIGREVYLGNSVWADFDGWEIELYGLNREIGVMLDPPTVAALIAYAKTLGIPMP